MKRSLDKMKKKLFSTFPKMVKVGFSLLMDVPLFNNIACKKKVFIHIFYFLCVIKYITLDFLDY